MSLPAGTSVAPLISMTRISTKRYRVPFGILILLSFLCFERAHAGSLTTTTFKGLTDYITLNKVSSLSRLIPLMPDEMRSSFTLMRHSKSMQEATPTFPRVIMFSHDGHFICAFNGDESEDNFDNLECMEFIAEAKTFELHEIVFPGSHNQITTPAFSQLNTTVDEKVSCTECHGQDPRPNWEIYPHWPGAYGSFDDYFDHEYAATLKKDDPQSLYGMLPEIEEERLQYVDFQKMIKPGSRYAALLFPEGSKYSPYGSGDEYQGNRFLRPNFRLSQLVSILNAKRDARLLLKQPRSRSFLFLLAMANCPTDLTQPFFPRYYQNYDGANSRDPYLNSGSQVTFPDGRAPGYIRSVRGALHGAIPVSEWVPVFQGLDPKCSACDPHSGTNYVGANPPTSSVTVPAGAYAWTYDYTTGSQNTMNYYVATEVMTELVKKNTSLAPYFRTMTDYNLKYEKQKTTTPKELEDLKLLDQLGLPIDIKKLNQACGILSLKTDALLLKGL